MMRIYWATNNNSIYPQFIDSFLDISQDQDLLKILRSKIKRKNRKYNNNNVQDNTNKLLEKFVKLKNLNKSISARPKKLFKEDFTQKK